MIRSEVEAAYEVLVKAFAGQDPLPAGGSAGVVAIAMGIALGTKLCFLSPRMASQPDFHDELERLQQRIMPEFAEDSTAFSKVLFALNRPRDDSERSDSIRAAWLGAAQAPASVAVLAAEAEALLVSGRSLVKSSVAGDLIAAIELVRAGRRIAVGNALENASRLDPEARQKLVESLPPKEGPVP